MELINDQLYNFYTEPGNFTAVQEIQRDYRPLRKRLLLEFWQTVNKEIRELLPDGSWHLWFPSNIEDGEDGISLTKEEFFVKQSNSAPVYLCYIDLCSKPYMSLWINDSLNLDKQNIWNEAEKFSNEWEITKIGKTNEDLMWKWLQLDFNRDEDLVQILPSNRSGLAKKLASDIFQNAINLLDFMKAIAASATPATLAAR